MKFRVLYFVVLVFLSCTSIFSQVSETGKIMNNKGTQTMVKGTIIDVYTGNPVGCELEFKPKSGNRIKTKSNPNTGKFEQLLNNDEKFTVTFLGYDIMKEEVDFQVKGISTGNYSEQTADFKVKKFVVGSKLFSYDLFESSSSDMKSNLKTEIEKLQLLLKMNRGLSVEIQVSASDSYLPSSTSQINTDMPKVNEMKVAYKKGKDAKSKDKKAPKAPKVDNEQARQQLEQKRNEEIAKIKKSDEEKALSLANPRLEKIKAAFGDMLKSPVWAERITFAASSNLDPIKSESETYIVVKKLEDKLK